MVKQVTDAARIADIASKLHAACGAIGASTRDIADHQQEVQALSGQLNGIGGTRLSVATEVAAMAHADAWSSAELVQACAQAAKMGNSNDATSKTINVFISEMKTFAHPKVREAFPTIAQACQDAWLTEQEYLAGLDADERKSADTPVRKFKSRIYHLTIEIARRVKDGELVVTSADDIVAWSRAHDPDHDEEKVAKRLAKIVEDLSAMMGDFGFDPIETATNYLRTISAKELLAARKAMLAEQDDIVDGLMAEQPEAAPPGSKVSVTLVAPAAPAPAPAAITPPIPLAEQETSDTHDTTGIADGAADLADLLNDPTMRLAA